MYESAYDNYSSFEELERERERAQRMNARIYHDYGEKKIEEDRSLDGPGYSEIDTDIFVREEDSFSYALERISQDEELKKEFVEWFYSENWIKED